MEFKKKKDDDIPLERYFSVYTIDGEKLQKIVAKKYGLSKDEFERILKEEVLKYAYRLFKNRILSRSPKSLDDFIICFIEYWKNIDPNKNMSYEYMIRKIDSINTFFLEMLLKEQNIQQTRFQILDRIKTILETRMLEEYEEELFKKYDHKLKTKAPHDEFLDWQAIEKMNGYEFEEFLKNLFAKLGYKVVHTKLSGDQGADLVISKDDEKIVVQAKKYTSGKVGNKAIQEIVASIKYYNADKGMVVTTSEFTPAARELARANDIILIDKYKLKEILRNFDKIYDILFE